MVKVTRVLGRTGLSLYDLVTAALPVGLTLPRMGR